MRRTRDPLEDFRLSHAQRIKGPVQNLARQLSKEGHIPRRVVRELRDRLAEEECSEELRKGATLLGLGDAQAGSPIEEIWAEAAGDEALRHTKHVSLRGNKLVVKVESPVWVHELGVLRKAEILDKLRALVGGERIRSLKVDVL